MPRPNTSRQSHRQKRRLLVERLESRELLAGDLQALNLADVVPITTVLPPGASSPYAAAESPPVTPSSVALPFGPDYQSYRQCGDFQCLIQPNLLASAMLPDGTLRLVGSSANINPSPLTVWDVDSHGQILRQFSVSEAAHVDPFTFAGSAISLSPSGQYLTIGAARFDLNNPTAAPQYVPRPSDVPAFTPATSQVANDGSMVLSWNGSNYLWDEQRGLRRLDSVFLNKPDADPLQLGVYPSAIATSFDVGEVVVGNSGGNGDYGHATAWYYANPLALPDFGHPSSASAVSTDGHLIGGEIRDVGAVIWIDGRPKVLQDEQHNLLSGTVTSIVTGFGGSANRWAALGTAGGQPFIAFNDGVAHPLGTWLQEQYGIHLADERLMGVFYHDGALSLITGQFSQCSSAVPFDPIDCSMSPPTQLAAHLTVVPAVGPLASVDPLAPAPFQVHFAPENAPTIGVTVPIAGGFEMLGASGNESVVNQYDRTGQITRTIHLGPLPGQTTYVLQFSDDGQWVKGYYDPYHPADTPVYWDLSHPDVALTEDQLDPASRPSFSTAAASADGRVVTGVGSPTYSPVTVQVDGVTHEIHDSSGTPLVGRVDHLFAGIGGVATRWIAVGEYTAHGPNGDYGDNFIAFSDGSMMRLVDFLHDQWPDGNLFLVHSTPVALANGSLLFIDPTFSGPNCTGLVCGNVEISTGYSITSVPLPDKWVHSPLDISGDNLVRAEDALTVINYLNDHLGAPSANSLGIHSSYDVNDDGKVSPLDALLIINQVNHDMAAAGSLSGGAEGEGLSAQAVDDLFAAAAGENLDASLGRRPTGF